MSRNHRNNKKTNPESLKPLQPHMVAVPISGTIHIVKASATNRGAAISLAKQLLVEKGELAPQQDIKYVAKAVAVTAKVGDAYGEADHRAATEAKQLVGV
jgi:hypothetical protein